MDKKKIRLYGAGGHSQVVREILEDNGFEVTDTFDDKPEGSHYATKKIASGARGDLTTFPHEGPPVIIAVGINKHRAEIANFLKCKFEKAIHKSSIIANSARIGEGTVVIAGAIINPNSVVGKHVLVNTAASIGHDCVIGDFAHISPKAALCGHVEVGEGSHVGVGAVVIPKVKIGKWCTVGAGTVVIRDIPDYATVVGNPGKIIKTMKIDNMNETKSKIADITFVGSGISSSFTLLNLLDIIESEKDSSKVKINIIDKYDEFNSGVPYGSRSGFSVLLITSLKDFLPEPELSKFKKWLNNNKKWLLDKFKKDGGKLSENWLEEHKDQIQDNDWDDLFIPRSFFGVYITERVKRKVEILKTEGLVEVNYMNSEVVDVEKNNNTYDLILEDKSKVSTKKVILSVGSLPINYLWKSKRLVEKDNLLFVNNPYNPNLKEVLNKIENFTSKKGNKINALIVGTNASGLELLYKLNDIEQIRDKIDNFTFLSTQGMIPNAIVDKERAKDFVTSNLNALQSKKELTAKEIAEAAFKDLDYAEEINLGAASTVGKISAGFGSLLNKLSEKELEEFACCYGNEIGRRQRCAGDHYLRTIDKLKKENRFKHLAGRFNDIKSVDNQYYVDYLETESQKIKSIDEPIHLVINCVGSMKFDNKNTPSLIKNLIAKKYCTPNKSRIGFDVNEDFESKSNFHIMGPLLAGNIIDNKPIWHVEHCGRIIWLSKLLAKKIHDKTLLTKQIVDG